MKKDCECQYCKGEVDEYFCPTCGLNFNECESFNTDEDVLCPRCHPSYIPIENDEKNMIKYNVSESILNFLNDLKSVSSEEYKEIYKCVPKDEIVYNEESYEDYKNEEK